MLLIMAALFYLPHFVWHNWECGTMEKLLKDIGEEFKKNIELSVGSSPNFFCSENQFKICLWKLWMRTCNTFDCLSHARNRKRSEERCKTQRLITRQVIKRNSTLESLFHFRFLSEVFLIHFPNFPFSIDLF
jgi:hypothetical protein